MQQSLFWFLRTDSTKDKKFEPLGGLNLCLYAIKNHNDLTKLFVDLVDGFCSVNDQVALIYKDELQNHTLTLIEYISVISDLLPFLSTIRKEALVETGLISFWIDICAREGENDRNHSDEDRIIALTLLSELWLIFTEYIDQHYAMVETIVFMFKRAVRDQCRQLRMVSIA